MQYAMWQVIDIESESAHVVAKPPLGTGDAGTIKASRRLIANSLAVSKLRL